MNCDELLVKWRPVIHQARHIWSWTELEVLAYCAEVASHSSSLIESGSYLGKSAKVMLLANPDLKLVCVDTFRTAGLEHTFRHFLRDEIVEGRCRVIVGDSAQAGNELAGNVYDGAWIDDGHAPADLVRDITSLMPLLKVGGLMWGHDWDGDNDVAQGVKSVLPMSRISLPHPRVWQVTKLL